MRHLLAATDLSARGQKALHRGLLLARAAAARVTVLHVVDADQPLQLRDEALHRSEAWLTTALDAEATAGLELEIQVVPGPPDATIIELAEKAAVDLVVMGAHRRHLVRDVFVGTTIERVMRGTALPVLMVNREPELPYDEALVAIDFSATSEHALQVAAGLGFLGAEKAFLLHAYQSVDTVVLAAGGAAPEAIHAHDSRTAGQALGELRRMAERHAATDANGVELCTLMREGPPVDVITRVAEEETIPLVVIGSRGHTGILRLLLGSTAENYLRTTTTTDVLVVSPATSPAAAT